MSLSFRPTNVSVGSTCRRNCVVNVKAHANVASSASTQKPSEKFVDSVKQWMNEQTNQAKELKGQLKGCNFMAAAILPLANITRAAADSSTEIYLTLSKCLEIYMVILTVRVLMTWFRNISWYSEPWKTLAQFTDPYLNVFRGIIPPIGGIDLSAILAFFALRLLANFLRNMAYSGFSL